MEAEGRLKKWTCEDCGKTYTQDEYDDLDWYDGPRCNASALEEEEHGICCGGIVCLQAGEQGMSEDTRPWCWRDVPSGEVFGPFNTREEALADARKVLEEDGESWEGKSVVLCRVAYAKASEHIAETVDLGSILDELVYSAVDAGALGEEGSFQFTNAKEAEKELVAFLQPWAEKWITCDGWVAVDGTDTPL